MVQRIRIMGEDLRRSLSENPHCTPVHLGRFKSLALSMALLAIDVGLMVNLYGKHLGKKIFQYGSDIKDVPYVILIPGLCFMIWLTFIVLKTSKRTLLFNNPIIYVDNDFLYLQGVALKLSSISKLELFQKGKVIHVIAIFDDDKKEFELEGLYPNILESLQRITGENIKNDFL